MSRIKKALICALCLIAASAILVGSAFFVYSRVGRRPFGRINAETVSRVTLSFTEDGKYNKRIEDHEIDCAKINREFHYDYFDNLRVYFPYDDQRLLYFGGIGFTFTIYKTDGSVHTVQMVDSSDNDIDTGYYIDKGNETYPIMKKGTPTYFLRIDGIIYDVRKGGIYENIVTYAQLLAAFIRRGDL